MAQNKPARKSKGFTIIELMMAMAFLAFILIFVVGTIVQLLRVYNKGVTLKQINQSSRTVIENMNRDIAGSKQVLTTRAGGASATNRICTDVASYVWNTRQDIRNNQNDASKMPNRYSSGNQLIGLVRSDDTTLCSTQGGVKAVDPSTATELLGGGAAVNTLQVGKKNNISKLYEVRLGLGTSDPAGYVTIPGPDETVNTCAPSPQGDFCATAEFVTIVYARSASQ